MPLMPVAIVESGGGGGLFDAYAYLRHEETSGTDGGAATTGSFQTYVITTEVFDTGNFVSLSSNQFTLGAATYLVSARAPFFRVGSARLKLRNVTDATDLGLGNNAYSQDSAAQEGECMAHLLCRFTLAGSKALELQYRCIANDGGNTGCLGKSSGFGTEIYGEVEIWREAA